MNAWKIVWKKTQNKIKHADFKGYSNQIEATDIDVVFKFNLQIWWHIVSHKNNGNGSKYNLKIQ